MGLPPALLLMLCLCPVRQGLAPPDPGLLAQGRARLREAQTLARHPQLGACWAGALGRLDGGCQQLGEEQQSRIALAFAHCHLQRSGRPFPRCEASSSVRACTQHMDPVAFGVYTEFFTHAHSICYLLRSEAWQQQAESTVHRCPGGFSGHTGGSRTATPGLRRDREPPQLPAPLPGGGVPRPGLLPLPPADRQRRPAAHLQPAHCRGQEALASWVGLCRRLCVGAGLAVLAYCVLTYRDVAQQSREVLQGLQETRAQMQHILQETEHLLAQWGPDPSQDNAEFTDSGFPGPLSRPEQGAPWAELLSTSSPKSRSRSPARQRPRPQRHTSRRDSETHNVPVPLDRLCCYDLRRRPALRDPPQTSATVKGPLRSARRGRPQLPAAGAILLSPTWDQTPTA
ncbi:uncharacterized protein LOC119847146 isoform X8 [Dermochelys coriacea]|uniref:uncharacterized protein LOC119847146 isoform X8 n=1 Tax=Dermochelys coriacea TaxID=27794 RepID=UPI0018E85EF2|nr:uncharacterized protein LOC119847146 isoform X8 [Dermochelys coriacea]